jgi:hypothetical protein
MDVVISSEMLRYFKTVLGFDVLRVVEIQTVVCVIWYVVINVSEAPTACILTCDIADGY